MAGNKEAELEEFGIETAKSAGIYVGAQLVSSLISFVTLILPARLLGPADFGIFIIAISFTTLLGFGGNLSFGSALRRMLPQSIRNRRRLRSLLCNAYVIGSISGLAITALAFVFGGSVATMIYHDSRFALPLQIASLMIILTVLFNLGLSALVGLGRAKDAAVSDLLYSATQLAAVAILLFAGYGIAGAVAGMLAGFLAGTVSEAFYLRKAVGSIAAGISRKVIREILRFSLPVFASDISTMGLTNFAVLFLGAVASEGIVGNYGVAFKLGTAFQVVTVSSTFIMLSAFSRALDRARLSKRIQNIYANSVYYSFLFVLPALAYLVASARPFTYMLFSSSYSLAPAYFVVIALGVTLGIFSAYSGNLMLAYGYARRFMRYQLVAIGVSFALLLLLTPLIGVAGILLSLFVVSPVLLALLYGISLARDFGLTLQYRKILAVAMAALITTLVSIALMRSLGYGEHTALLANFLIVLLAYPALSAALGGITARNVLFLRKFAGRLGPASALLLAVLAYTSKFVR